MEPWARRSLIKQEPEDQHEERLQRSTTIQAMGLDRIMSGTPPSSWPPRTTNDQKSSSLHLPSVRPSPVVAAPTSSSSETSAGRIPAQDIILSTLHQLLDPSLQPPPPQPRALLPRRPDADSSIGGAFRSSSSTSSTDRQVQPPSRKRAADHGTSTAPSSAGRSPHHRQESSGTSGARDPTPSASSTTRGYPIAHSHPLLAQPQGQGFVLPGGLTALDPSALQQLLQVVALYGVSPQLFMASIAQASAGGNPHQQSGSGAMASISEVKKASSTASVSAPAPRIPDPTYPRTAAPNKLPLPKVQHGTPSLVPSPKSAFTSLKRSADDTSPPRTPNPPTPSATTAASRSSQIYPTPMSAITLPPFAAPSFMGFTTALPTQPPVSTGDAQQTQIQQYVQFLAMLQQQQQQQSSVAPGLVPLPYLAGPIPIITTSSPLPSPPSTSSFSSTANSNRPRTSSERAKREGEGDPIIRARDDYSVGRTSSNAGVATSSGDTRKRRLDDGHSHQAERGRGSRDGGSSARSRRRVADEGSDEEDLVKRKRISQDQLDVLEAAYLDDPLPSRRTKQRLSAQLGISIKRVQIWFQNRRAKQKRQRRDESDSGGDTFPEEGSDDTPSGGLFGLMD